jgi:isopentenyldiphosphate isomerase
MGEEIFDVVNDHDEVVEQRPRREVHQFGLKHRAIHLLVFNQKGKLFLQKRSMLKDCFPGTWDSSASGHLNVSETYDECVIREAREEIGLSLQSLPERLFKIDACPDTGMEFVWIYRCSSEGPFELQPEEVDEGSFFSSAEIDRWIASRPADFARAFVRIWAELGTRGLK